MDDSPTDLDDLPAQAPDPDGAVAVALRRAMDGQAPDPAVLLAGVQARAARHRRRRIGVAGTAVAGTVAAAALVLPAVLPGSRDGASPAGRTTPAAVAPDDRLRSGEHEGDPPTASANPLLSTAEVTAFPGVDLALRSTGEGGLSQPAVGGACTAAALPVPTPSRSWQADWTGVAAGARHVALAETVWQWDDPAPAGAALDAIRAQVAGCSGPGAEGLSPPVEQDAGYLWPVGGRVLALTRQGRGPTQEVQVVVVSGTTLVRLEAAGSTTADGGAAVDALARTARTAVKQALQASQALQESRAAAGAAEAQVSADAAARAAADAQAASAAASSAAPVIPRTPSMVTHGPDPRQ